MIHPYSQKMATTSTRNAAIASNQRTNAAANIAPGVEYDKQTLYQMAQNSPKFKQRAAMASGVPVKAGSAYDQGFAARCDELGVDPEQLMKTAGKLDGLMNLLHSAGRGIKAFGSGAHAGAKDLFTMAGNIGGGRGLTEGLSQVPASLSGKSRAAWQAGDLVSGGVLGGLALSAPISGMQSLFKNKDIHGAPDKTPYARKLPVNPEYEAKLKELYDKGYRGGDVGVPPENRKPGYLR